MAQRGHRAAAVGFLFAAIFLTPFAASAGTSCAIHATLKRGARSVEVSVLQQFLIQQGFLASGSTSGYFGSATEKGLQNWQIAKNIVLRGTPSTTGFGATGPRTRAAILASCGSAPLPHGIPPSTGGVSASSTKPVPQNSNCPLVPLPIGKACSGTWQEVKDSKNCTASWQCVAS